MREQGLVVINDIRGERRWPRFIPRAIDLGLRAQMGVRLFADGKTVGGLNLYSTETDQIDPETIHIARLFSSHAALALGVERMEKNFIAGMASRQRVGVAIGILMQRYDLDEDGAFEYLARVSQTSNTRLRDIADELVESASKRNARTPRPHA
jgi:ANTAR domain/GAF domain